MSVDKITKEEFDRLFKNTLEQVEQEAIVIHKQYVALLGFRSQYRKDYKTHRIGHSVEEGMLKYHKIASRTMGFKRK